MEILVAILIIALIAAIAFAAMQRRPGGVGRRRTSPVVRRDRIPRGDPMATAVAEHAQAMDPDDVVAAEQRLKAQARAVAAPMQAEANRVEHQRASDQVS